MVFKARNSVAPNAPAHRKLVLVICAFVLSGIFTAGLWPFHAPKNEVSWLGNGDGLLFGEHGSVVTAGAFNARQSEEDAACSLEIWAQPARTDSSGTILAFYQPDARVVPFALRQSLGDLVLQRKDKDIDKSARSAKIYVDDVFSQHQPVFVSITSDKNGTRIYVDGLLIKASPNFRLSRQDLTGRLVMGNSPITTNSWSGQLKGLAIYERDLTSGQVPQHYKSWLEHRQLDLAKSESSVALYLFKEDQGSIVHNEMDATTDFLIPERFFALHPQFLEAPWDEFRPDWSYWKDVAINILGFIPLGFSFYAYFSASSKIKRATALTIGFGFAVSLAIEILQAFLPTRDSGMTDIMTNTLGTAIGAMLYRYSSSSLILEDHNHSTRANELARSS